ncbi:hypothetical protein H257_10676 [Aphanomyces astaci]|uniref:WW domain-containing protein n=1 Tax=Aphanomyces astaci TaxID=112090 RepID=W4G833_APHAT|nr:hypothetical protein H257_10676 [Aphanomyces astaci]ETV75083.1 hypothetical protein H257_10676 [Aphanomyces astaci]|eukprot:XP_009835587.1 hypothetical protein H257_10676 [Aphanomyces astaci]
MESSMVVMYLVANLKRKKKLVKWPPMKVTTTKPQRDDGLLLSFPKSKRFEYGHDLKSTTSTRCPTKASRRPAPPKLHTEINAGIYVLQNKHTGHAFFGSTWDLANAKSQNWADLTSGAHGHKAMVRTVQMYGLGDISFHVLQRIPTASEFHFRELEELLETRLVVHTRRAQQASALRVFNTWQHNAFALAWPRWQKQMERAQHVEGTAAAVEIQRTVRGWQGARRALRRRHSKAATAIQRVYRGWTARRHATHLKHTQAAQTLQRLGRFFVDRVRWTRAKVAIQLMQRTWRGYVGRRTSDGWRRLRRQATAAQTLQANLWAVHCSRKWKRQRNIRLVEEGSVTIQRRWRGVLGRRRAAAASGVRDGLRQREGAARIVQESWHAYQGMKFQWTVSQLVTQGRSQRLLRRTWRNYIARKFGWAATRIRVATAATIVLQNSFRAYQLRQVYHRWCQECRRTRAVIRLQALGRGYIARTLVVPERRQQLLEQHSANIVGCWYRSMKWRYMISFLRRTNKATMIQAAFRAHVARTRFQACKHEWAREKAALAIQCAFRCCRARRRVAFKRWLRSQGPCMECQEAVAEVFALAYSLELCNSCSNAMGQQIKHDEGDWDTMAIEVYRSRYRHATKIAATYRGYAQRQTETQGVCATCNTRAIHRICLTCHESFCHSCSHVTHSLSYNRQHTPYTLTAHRQRTIAATRIQSRFRCFVHRHTVALLRSENRTFAAIRIQGWWRARYVRHLVFLDTQRQAALDLKRDRARRTLQRVYRGHRGRLAASARRKRVEAAIAIQAHFRASVAKRLVRREREVRLCARRQHAAVVMQCAYRQHCARVELHQRRLFVAARTIQCAVRVFAAGKVLRALQIEYELKVQAAVTHMKHRRKVRAVIQIQSQYRRRRDLRVAVAKRLARAAAQRQQALTIAVFAQTLLATRLERWYRRRYRRLNASAMTIQRGMWLHWGRQARQKWRQRQKDMAKERAIVRLQCFGRSIMAKREFRALKVGSWVECLDETSGCCYYYHTATQATSWVRSPEFTLHQCDDVATPQGSNQVQHIKEPAWVQVWDDTYQAYYYVDQVTGDTTWTAPDAWEAASNQHQT